MNNSKAEQGICPYKTAEQHIQKMNPSMWDGKGRKPKTFDTRICMAMALIPYRTWLTRLSISVKGIFRKNRLRNYDRKGGASAFLHRRGGGI